MKFLSLMRKSLLAEISHAYIILHWESISLQEKEEDIDFVKFLRKTQMWPIRSQVAKTYLGGYADLKVAIFLEFDLKISKVSNPN